MKRTSKRFCAFWLCLLFCGTVLTGCSKTAPPADVPEIQVPDIPETEATPAATLPPTDAHVSPTETIISELGSQADMKATLYRDGDDDAKVHKTSLSALIQPGDTVRSFTFVLYAADGVSDIGELQGGCGISVTEGCPGTEEPGWYIGQDFTAQAQGSYIEATWNVPPEIAPYLDPKGDVQFGYWWGETESVILRNVICTYSRSEICPVDGMETVSVEQTIDYSDKDNQSLKVPIGELLGEEGVPQAITFEISADSGFQKFTGAFGIASGNNLYMTETIAVLTDSDRLSLTWLVPDDIAYDMPRDAEVFFGYWWGAPTEMTLHSMTVKYSIGGTRPEKQTGSQEVTEKDMQTANSAAAIAADIRVGWNLGNTLDCYDKNNGKTVDETYWGNPRVTQELLDTVKAKGFRAVRIPVSWTNHIDKNGKIRQEWLDRVQQVVDYAVNNDLYVILNMHHDDYTWLCPNYAQEKAVTEKYTAIWHQIANRFRNYDTKLLFEAMNEPRLVKTNTEWTGGTEEERDVINHLLAEFVKTVRDSGGKNPERTLIVTTHGASITDAAIDGLVLPDDDNLIVSVHNYAPWKFTTRDYPDATLFDSQGRTELDSQFAMLHEKFISKGIPVIIGEFGAENKSNDLDRIDYYNCYLQTAAKYGIPCFIWDNGLEESYGLIDRTSNDWFPSHIAEDAVKAVTEQTE